MRAAAVGITMAGMLFDVTGLDPDEIGPIRALVPSRTTSEVAPREARATTSKSAPQLPTRDDRPRVFTGNPPRHGLVRTPFGPFPVLGSLTQHARLLRAPHFRGLAQGYWS